MAEKSKPNIPMVLMVILLAMNMRACYTGVGTIVGIIQDDLGLSSTVAGLLTTIPIVVFAVVCPSTAPFAGKYGIGRMIQLALFLIGGGTVLRAFAGSLGLFAGTTLLAVGVGIMNTVMAGWIKLRFSEHTGIFTTSYTTTMALTSAMAMGLNVPAERVIGWRGALAIYVLITIPTIFLWWPQAGLDVNRGAAQSGEKGLMGKLLRSPRAWALMIFMGTQSMMFYCISAWLPSILRWRGMSTGQAAAVATTVQLLSLPTTLLFPILAERFNWRRLVLLFNTAYIIGAAGFYLISAANPLMWLFLALLASGVGTGFSACVFLFSKRAKSPAEASAISGFSQSGGYVLAAVGPVLMGRIYDSTGSWNSGMLFCGAIILVMTVASAFSTEQGPILP